MSDGDKPFAATPSRRDRAKREGNVVRSAEACSVAAFGGALLAACAAVPWGAEAAASSLAHAAARPFATAPSLGVAIVLLAALVPAGAAAFVSAGVAFAQGSGVHLRAVSFDPRRLDPIAGMKRMLGGEAVVALMRAAAAFAAATAAIVPLGAELVSAGVRLGSPGAAAALVGWAAVRACATALAVGACFAVADYALARRRWLRGLRMSYDEIKRDAKEHDGDPQARARRAGAHREIVRGAIGRTREASFVVVNPTHVAVALRYAPPEVPVPEILVRALDAAALEVRAIAREHAIPIVEDIALARLLYGQGRAGRAIPTDAYVAVAQIVAALAREGALS